MDANRTNLSYSKKIYDFLDHIYVICPHCKSKALVKSPKNPLRVEDGKEVTLSCTNCGYNKVYEELPPNYVFRSSRKLYSGRYLNIGGPIDPYFYQPVWLQSECKGNKLWAYNYDHLSLLENHITAYLRERNGLEKINKSIGSRLPRWMTSSKNRKDVLKAIAALKKK